MSSLVIDYGNIAFQTSEELTIQAVTNLAKSAEIAGIPPTAVITSIHFRYGFGAEGRESRIDIGWKMK